MPDAADVDADVAGVVSSGRAAPLAVAGIWESRDVLFV
jgi:hypothetical protein